MVRLAALVLWGSLLLTGCGGDHVGSLPGADTPEAAYEAAKACARDKDWDGLWVLLSEEARGEIRPAFDRAQKIARSDDEAAKRRLGRLGATPRQILGMEFKEFFSVLMTQTKDTGSETDEFIASQLVDVKTIGPRARVRWRCGDKSDNLELVQRDGRWFLATLD